MRVRSFFVCFDVYLRNNRFIIIFIECFQLLVSQKNNVCVCVHVCIIIYCLDLYITS